MGLRSLVPDMTITMVSDQYSQLRFAVKAIHYAFPATCFLYFGINLVVTVCTLQTQRLRIQDQHVRRNVILALIIAVTGTYIIEAIITAIKCFIQQVEDYGQDATEDRMVYLVASSITFAIQTIALSDAKFPVWYPYYGTWLVGIIAEIMLVVMSDIIQGPPRTAYRFVLTIIQAVRVCLFLALPAIYFGLRNDKKAYDNSDAERQALLSKKLAAKPSSSQNSVATTEGYGTTSDTTAQESGNVSETDSEDSWLAEQRKAQELIAKRLKQDGNWFTYAKGFAIFFPYIWPVHSKTLQFRAILVGCCLLLSNALNVLVPRQLGIMVDGVNNHIQDPVMNPDYWTPVLGYAILVFISGGACIGWIRKWLWLPVEQYSYDALSTASHAHLMSLSSDFHDSKSSSDLAQAISGGRSVADLLETVCFQVIPMFIDLIIAFGYLSSLFGPYMGLILVTEAITYLYTTTKLVALRAEKRREYVAIFRKEWTVAQQSLDGWNTASLFNQIPYERHRYACAVKEHMKSKRDYELSSQSISAAQAGVMAVGLLGALSLGVYQVAYGDADSNSIGKLTQLLVYWGQLQSPLSFFSNMYRNISYSLMDAERLLELFQTKPTITDGPKAKPLKLTTGEVEFNNVSFAYDVRKPTLKNVTFVVPSGKTVALVGETGGGKTTILKLIDRFYDCKTGGISIDGQDIRDITLDSLRACIGVVPQDPLMFHDSIMNNIRYARLTASDEEVYEACRAAAVHDKIMTFPDGYNSKVGDRGVKLSGGEKQRVAIARAMLKKPEIILLDEATSSVDTETESNIQEGFKKLCKDRTTFIVAHRLSTVMRADHILVVMNGEIVEQGSHYELIHKKGKYHDLWSKQIFTMPDDKRARSKSPKKRDADLLNDLSPERCKAELAKALQTTEDEEISCSAEHDGGQRTTEVKPDSGHKREVCDEPQ